MSLLLPGEPGRFTALVRLKWSGGKKLNPGQQGRFTALFRGLALVLCMASVPAFGGEAAGDRRSGVVKPVITQLSAYMALKAPDIEEFVLPKKYSIPHGIAIDSKDRIWITEMGANSLAMFDPVTSTLKEYRIPSTVGLPESDWKYDSRNRTAPTNEAINIYSVGEPGALIVDSSDTIWFVMQLGNSVARFDPVKEEFTEFIIPTPNSLPYDLASDSKGLIWFVEKNKGNLGYLDVEKKKNVEIKIGAGASLMGITIDSKDKIWIGDTAGNYIARYDPDTKKIRKFPISVPLSQPGQMRFDKNGFLWICNLHSQQLGVLMPDSGVYSVVDLPGWNAVPQALAIAQNGDIWIVDSMTNQIGFFDQKGLGWTIFSIPTSNAQPMNMAIDSKGDIWFTQSDRNANKIARLFPSTIVKSEASAKTWEKGGNVANKKKGEQSGSGKTLLYVLGVVGFAFLFVGAFLFIRRRSKS